ncbi:hypothetical protein EW145_g5357 [Phellinidium pouzarii]|uniref:U three protein 23 n=1 Tax=Phellinidium pouzarii TaxID=167371 RepID=A0A4S4L0A9_9AGAM|nr:hypothetical protein EW145_g5357 [Phellinidium pouzarii]
MRQKRAKAYRKLMHLYCMSFGFRQPYQVLVDAEMCQEAVASKIDLSKQLANVLQASVKPMITQCSIHSLYLSGRSSQPAVDLAKTFERRRCNHREAKPEEECVREVIGATNTHRYVLASQSITLRQYIRLVPGTPIVHVKRSVMVLEPASNASERVKGAMEAGQMRPTDAEVSAITSSLAAQESTAGVVEAPKKKRKGPKGPNPLSVKKKKTVNDGRRPGTGGEGKKKVQDHKERAGEKRKRSDDDEDDDEAAGESSGGTNDSINITAGVSKIEETAAAGRRRRRRRKIKGDDVTVDSS